MDYFSPVTRSLTRSTLLGYFGLIPKVVVLGDLAFSRVPVFMTTRPEILSEKKWEEQARLGLEVLDIAPLSEVSETDESCFEQLIRTLFAVRALVLYTFSTYFI